MQNEITFLINTSEITAGTRGSSLGPGALFAAARKQGSTLFGDFPMIHVPEQNYLLDHPTRFPFAKRIDGLVNTFEAISSAVQQVFSENRFPFIIASDHGSAGGTIAGIKAQFPNKRLGVIWIDAHGDLHSPYTTPSGNMHGMPLSTALNEDNLPCKSNELDSETITFWNALKKCGGIVPKINPEDLCFVAVRDTESQEDALIERLNIKNFTVAEVRNEGTDSIAERILEKLENCDLIYISFDVDSMDPKLTSYGTGTPVADGLTPDEAKNLMLRLLDSPKIACLEVVEINPCLDDKINTMAETTFEIVKPIIQKIQSK